MKRKAQAGWLLLIFSKFWWAIAGFIIALLFLTFGLKSIQSSIIKVGLLALGGVSLFYAIKEISRKGIKGNTKPLLLLGVVALAAYFILPQLGLLTFTVGNTMDAHSSYWAQFGGPYWTTDSDFFNKIQISFLSDKMVKTAKAGDRIEIPISIKNIATYENKILLECGIWAKSLYPYSWTAPTYNEGWCNAASTNTANKLITLPAGASDTNSFYIRVPTSGDIDAGSGKSLYSNTGDYVVECIVARACYNDLSSVGQSQLIASRIIANVAVTNPITTTTLGGGGSGGSTTTTTTFGSNQVTNLITNPLVLAGVGVALFAICFLLGGKVKW